MFKCDYSTLIVLFYDQAPIIVLDEPISVHVPSDVPEESIITFRQFSSEATAMLADFTEARPLIRTELTVKTFDCGQIIFGLVDCAATLDFVSKDFVRRFALQTRKSQTKTPVRLANGQRVTSSALCDIVFELARHEIQRTFSVLLDLRVVDLVLFWGGAGDHWSCDPNNKTYTETPPQSTDNISYLRM
jgi:hypothetical protein